MNQTIMTIEDIISATSDEELLKIAVWADERETMASRIFKILHEGQLKESMIEKLREELGQLSSLDYAYQLSRYGMEGVSTNVIESVQRLDTEKVLIELMSSLIEKGNVLEFVKTSVAAILIMGEKPLIQNKIIEGIRGLTLESYHKQLIVYAVLHAKNYEFLKRLCLEDLDLPLIYTYDEEPTVRSDLRLLFSIHDEGDMRSFVLNLSESYTSAMQSLFEDCNDMDLRSKLFFKMLTELSQLPESFASELPKYMNFIMLKILRRCLI